MRNTQKILHIKSKRGSVLVPALFLLVFFVVMGSVILGAGEASVRDSKRSYESKQAYYSAKSAVDLIASSFEGKHIINGDTNAAIKGLADATDVLNANQSVSSKAQMFGSEVTSTITCIARVQEINGGEVQNVNIKAEAKYGVVKRAVSRDIEIERRMNGLPAGIFGVAQGSGNSDYTIDGTVVGIDSSAVVIKGSVRIENARTVVMNNVSVNGDLFINAEKAVRLKNVVVYGNVYINAKSPSEWSQFDSVALGPSAEGKYGDCIITSGGEFNFVAWNRCKDSNLYIKAPKVTYSSSALGQNVSFKNIYFAHGTNNLIPTKNLKGTIVKGTLANDAYDTKLENSDTSNLEINLKEPNKQEYDYTIEASITTQEDLEKKYPDGIETSSGEIKIEVDGSLHFLKRLQVRGGGTVNLYCDKSGIFDKDFVVERVDGKPTVVNFICTKSNMPFVLTEMARPLQANLIVPKGEIHMTNSTVEGTVMASVYRLLMSKEAGVLFDLTVPWAYTGSLDIGVGSSVDVKLHSYK